MKYLFIVLLFIISGCKVDLQLATEQAEKNIKQENKFKENCKALAKCFKSKAQLSQDEYGILCIIDHRIGLHNNHNQPQELEDILFGCKEGRK